MKSSAIFNSNTYSDIVNSSPRLSEDKVIKKSPLKIKGYNEEPLSVDEQAACNMATD